MKRTLTDAERAELHRWFRGWTVGREQAGRIRRLRESALALSECICESTQPCPDVYAALQHVRVALSLVRDVIAQEGSNV